VTRKKRKKRKILLSPEEYAHGRGKRRERAHSPSFGGVGYGKRGGKKAIGKEKERKRNKHSHAGFPQKMRGGGEKKKEKGTPCSSFLLFSRPFGLSWGERKIIKRKKKREKEVLPLI